MHDWGERDPLWSGVRSETIEVAHDPGAPDASTTVQLLRADGPSGIPALLIHGLGGSAANWLDVIPALAVDGDVVAMDLPGFGRTEPPDLRAARMRPQVKFLVALLDRLGWSRVRLHGNSMGGLLAVLLAAAAPDRVAHVVLTAPALPPPRQFGAVRPSTVVRFAPFLSWRLGAAGLGRLYARLSPEELRQQTLRLVLGTEVEDLRPPMREVQLDNVEVGKSATWRAPAFARAANDLLALLLRPRIVHDAMAVMTAPTLVIWGTDDRLVGLAPIQAAVARCPEWTRVDLQGAGHVPMLEVPDQWMEAVRQFTATLAPPASGASGDEVAPGSQ